jgi:hypothetical protein
VLIIVLGAVFVLALLGGAVFEIGDAARGVSFFPDEKECAFSLGHGQSYAQSRSADSTAE